MADERPENTGGKAGPEEGQGRRGGRHRGFRARHGGPREGSPRPSGPDAQREAAAGGAPNAESSPGSLPRQAQDPRDMPLCPLCGKPVYDLATAVSASRDTGEPAHFDCVLERVSASETLAATEKLVYLGSGSFAVVEFKDKNESAFSVKRRIQWEKEGEKKDWRKGISSRITNL